MTLEGFEPLTSVLQTYALPAATESSDCLPALWQLRHAVTYRRTTGLDNCFRVLPILQVPDVFLLSPHPLCPTMVMNSPFFTCRLMSCSTSIGCLSTRNCLFKCVTSIMFDVSISTPPCVVVACIIYAAVWKWQRQNVKSFSLFAVYFPIFIHNLYEYNFSKNAVFYRI